MKERKRDRSWNEIIMKKVKRSGTDLAQKESTALKQGEV